MPSKKAAAERTKPLRRSAAARAVIAPTTSQPRTMADAVAANGALSVRPPWAGEFEPATYNPDATAIAVVNAAQMGSLHVLLLAEKGARQLAVHPLTNPDTSDLILLTDAGSAIGGGKFREFFDSMIPEETRKAGMEVENLRHLLQLMLRLVTSASGLPADKEALMAEVHKALGEAATVAADDAVTPLPAPSPVAPGELPPQPLFIKILNRQGAAETLKSVGTFRGMAAYAPVGPDDKIAPMVTGTPVPQEIAASEDGMAVRMRYHSTGKGFPLYLFPTDEQ